ncbi:MAG: ABC transporter ATP-binding protein [Oscillospiraceae bacterium]|nr:ABC transporter ATP-binding protein [Oscillospiraceae bacterium]
MDAILSSKGLTKKYSKFTLGGIDLELPKGFATALIGANGAGKTTLIDVLCGVIHANAGEVTYFGEYKDIDSSELRERIGYCAAQGFFPAAWKAKDIAEAMSMAYAKFDRERFNKLCQELEVDDENTKKAKPMYKQSDGNRMRTALAAVFARETDLLILDEPGSTLDPLMRDRLCDRMRGYLDDGNGEKSILFSTHNIADMENAADYAVFMDKGQIIEQGFVEDLKDKYVIVRGDAADYDNSKALMLSHNVNKTVFEGLALAAHKNRFEAEGAVCERPTLQQLSIGMLKYAEERR